MQLSIAAFASSAVTAICAFWQILAVPELSFATQSVAQLTNNNLIRWEFYIVELAIYFVICYSLALVSRNLEARNASGVRARRPMLGLRPFQRAH